MIFVVVQIPPVVDGIIPVNKHGNVEVWEGNAAFVPKGARFIDNPGALKTALELQLPAVPAIVGFERRGLHTAPIIGGVVVLEEHAELVLDGNYFVDALKEEKHYQKRDREISLRWEKLTYGVMSRERLRIKYGH